MSFLRLPGLIDPMFTCESQGPRTRRTSLQARGPRWRVG